MMKLVTRREDHFREIGWEHFATPEESIDYFQELKYVEFDSETTGLSFMSSRLHCIQIGNFDTQYIVDTLTVPILWYKELLTTKLLLTANGGFDLVFLYAANIIPPMENIRDVFIREKILTMGKMYDEDIAAGLGDLVQRYLGITLDKKQQGNIAEEGLNSVENIVYSGNDVKYLEKVLIEQEKRLIDWDLMEVVWLEEMTVSVLAYVEFSGIYRDAETGYNLIREIEYEEWAALITLNNYLKDELPDLFDRYEGINWGSSKQVVPLFKELGINVINKKDKSESVDKKIISPQADDFPIIKLFIDFKEKNKLVTTYGKIYEYYPASDKRIHTKFKQIVDTGRMSSGQTKGNPTLGRRFRLTEDEIKRLKPFPNCLSEDTEVLTPLGWQKGNTIKSGDSIVTYDLDKDQLSWDTVQDTVAHDAELYRYSTSKSISIESTSDHRTLVKRKGEWLTIPAEEIKANDKIKSTSHLVTVETTEDADAVVVAKAEFLSAVQADATLYPRKAGIRAAFQLSKPRKIKKLKELIRILAIENTGWKPVKGRKTEYIYVHLPDWLWGFLDNKKRFAKTLIHQSGLFRKTFLKSTTFWDGTCSPSETSYFSVIKHNVEVVQSVAAVTGISSRMRIQRNGDANPNAKDLYKLYFRKNPDNSGDPIHVESLGVKPVWCVSVPSTYFLARVNGHVFVTGNCQNIPGETRFRQQFQGQGPNLLITADYSGQELVIFADNSEIPALLEYYQNGGTDQHSKIAALMYPEKLKGLSEAEIKAQFPELRGNAKVTGFTIVFGGTGYTIAQRMNKPPEHGEELYWGYVDSLDGMLDYMEKQKQVGFRDGYITIPNKFKRKRFVGHYDELRDKAANMNNLNRFEQKKVKRAISEIQRHSLNTVCQGYAADMTKLAAIYFMQEIIVRKWWKKVKIPNIVHDEIVAEAHQMTAPKVAPVLVECMERAGRELLKHVPIKATCEISKYWTK